LIAIFLALSSIFPPGYALTEEFSQKNHFSKWLYLYFSMLARRAQFYSAFMFMEGSCRASGLGYNGQKEGKDNWDRIIAGNPIACEVLSDPSIIIKV
jgi:hypothetical protein